MNTASLIYCGCLLIMIVISIGQYPLTQAKCIYSVSNRTLKAFLQSKDHVDVSHLHNSSSNYNSNNIIVTNNSIEDIARTDHIQHSPDIRNHSGAPMSTSEHFPADHAPSKTLVPLRHRSLSRSKIRISSGNYSTNHSNEDYLSNNGEDNTADATDNDHHSGTDFSNHTSDDTNNDGVDNHHNAAAGAVAFSGYTNGRSDETNIQSIQHVNSDDSKVSLDINTNSDDNKDEAGDEVFLEDTTNSNLLSNSTTWEDILITMSPLEGSESSDIIITTVLIICLAVCLPILIIGMCSLRNNGNRLFNITTTTTTTAANHNDHNITSDSVFGFLPPMSPVD